MRNVILLLLVTDVAVVMWNDGGGGGQFQRGGDACGNVCGGEGHHAATVEVERVGVAVCICGITDVHDKCGAGVCMADGGAKVRKHGATYRQIVGEGDGVICGSRASKHYRSKNPEDGAVVEGGVGEACGAAFACGGGDVGINVGHGRS